ncbi:putative arsenite methyltransferase [Tolypocladium ophioglossoides CBS 100239]|uniref:Arsenite methyltransferase n=1 Tax=Tolypocladium ophioglossoides (strain CBS 100239) TaxID=1163406 RepID=A0A0L0N4R2_TOLOC|nr:putative arsenite methyltransferase [Tolypocladium ophioglossoides CBS 100239]
METQEIYSEVNKRYTTAAKGADAKYGDSVAKAFGYSEQELATIPIEANLGLSCGNPLAIATIREGETVVDLGSGAGFDVFHAANKVGPSGKVIGVDTNKAMLDKARKLRADSGKMNTDFVESCITKIALESGIADCIISNCVVNLVPEGDKQLVFNEMFRMLRPGGRVAISDILAKKPLPEEIKKSMALYVGCIAGASQVADYELYLRQAGFKDILITDASADLNVYKTAPGDVATGGCCGTASTAGSDTLSPSQIEDLDYNEWTGSYKIYAVKA